MEVHTLDRKTVHQYVARREIGTYFLGEFTPDGIFVVKYVGRSLTCLRDRLLHHASMTDYPAFRFHLWPTVKEVFEMECLHYHLYYDQINNRRHPDSPRSIPLECNYCRVDPMKRRATVRMDAEHKGLVR